MSTIKTQGNDHKVAGTQERTISKAAEKKNHFIEKAKAYAKEKGVTFDDDAIFVTIGNGKRGIRYWRKSFSTYKELKSAIDLA